MSRTELWGSCESYIEANNYEISHLAVYEKTRLMAKPIPFLNSADDIKDTLQAD